MTRKITGKSLLVEGAVFLPQIIFQLSLSWGRRLGFGYPSFGVGGACRPKIFENIVLDGELVKRTPLHWGDRHKPEPKTPRIHKVLIRPPQIDR